MIKIFIALLFISAPAHAAREVTAEVPITVNIIDCSTQEKAQDECDRRNMCCHLLETPEEPQYEDYE